VTAAGLVGAWQAARDFDGRGDREAFARQRIKQRMLDYLRTSHPAGRSGLKIVATGGDEEAQDVAAPDDVLATVTARQELDALSGAEKREAAKHLPPAKRKTSPNFDPKAVKLHKGQPVPAPQRKRVNKYRQMLDRMTATDHCELDPVVANSLVSEMKKAKVRHCFRTLDNGLVGVWREPSAEQLKGIKKCQ
jgi:DNA-directed RNA polymerase specialized sigma subunit